MTTNSLDAIDQTIDFVAGSEQKDNNNNSNNADNTNTDTDAGSTVQILGLGNPLLDISSPVDDAFMEKYGIKPSNAILAEAKHLPMYGELSNMSTVDYIAGGSTLNSIRVAEWMYPGTGKTGYMGCIGKDTFGDKLNANACSDGVDCHFMVNADVSTGTCAVCVNKKDRSLVANLAAANEFKLSHVSDTGKAKAMLQSSKIIYSAGFFLTVSPDTMLVCAKQCQADRKAYAINFSAAFIVQVFQKQVLEVLPFVTHVFTNEDESKAFATANQVEYGDADMKCLAQNIADFGVSDSLYQRADMPRSLYQRADMPRTVVITQGKDPVIVATQGQKVSEVREYPVALIDAASIVDVNGAGDAFVGGFLSQLVQGKDEKTCVAAGNYCAAYILQRAGTKLDGTPSFSASS